jgi:hypothetical protein
MTTLLSLQRPDALLKGLNALAKGGKFGDDSIYWTLAVEVGRLLADEYAASLPAHDEIAEFVEGLLDRHGRDAVLIGQLPTGWKALSRSKVTTGDLLA